MLARDAHLNLVESSRRLFELDPRADVEDGEGWMFGAGRSTHPVISNARAGERPAGIAMTIVTHGVAGIYWVGCTEEARGRGLGWAVTAAAVNAGFDLGAEIASLQASPMGESLYRRMGFETIYDYRLYLCHPPEEAR